VKEEKNKTAAVIFKTLRKKLRIERTLVSSTNKTDRQNITEILLKVTLNTITHFYFWSLHCLSIFGVIVV
jgi:hypothetical protein